MKRIKRLFWHWIFNVNRATSKPTPISWQDYKNGISKPNEYCITMYRPMLQYRRPILLFALLLLITACEKQQTDYNGTYFGTTELYLSGQQQTTMSRRIISNHEAGTTKIHWWDAPNVDCYTVIEGDTYTITNVEILAETYCYGVKQSNKLLFCGKGRFIGDSLIEEGIVYHMTKINNTYELAESVTWRACFKKHF